MSITVPPGAGDAPLPRPVALADERDLRTAFLNEYRALAEEARTDLGAASNLSQKVVEGAFVRAWDARMKLKTAEELHQFLVDDVHHAAARALSRRAAAHRLGDSGHHDAHVVGAAAANGAHPDAPPEIDVDEAWSHIQHALHGEEHSAEALTEAAAISRHDAAHHIATATRERGWKILVAVGVLAALVVTALLVWLDRRADDGRLTRALAASDTRVVTSPAGRVGIVTLDDGSRVRLAPDSRLMIPATFGDRVRGVGIEGGASFEVAPGKPRPFRVSARQSVVVAIGTSFSVRDYPTDSGVTVDVLGGAVEIHHGDKSTTLASGDSRFLSSDGTQRPATAAERDEASGWASGTLTIDNRPLRDVLPMLGRWYGMSVKVPDASLLDRRVTVRASLDSSMQVIRGIERTAGLEFGYAGRDMVFRLPAAAPAAKGAPAKGAAARRR